MILYENKKSFVVPYFEGVSAMKFYEDRFKKTKERDFCFWLLFPFFWVNRRKKTLTLRAILRCRSKNPVALSDFVLKIGEVEHWLGIKTPFYDIHTPKEKHTAIIKIVIYRSDLKKLKKHNLVCLCKKHYNSILYNGLNNSYKRRHSPLLRDRKNGNIAYFRQSINGKLVVTVRKEMEVDKLSCKVREVLGYLFAKPISLFERKRPILMYEKYGRYEEGASILYEKLIDEGYKKIYFAADVNMLPSGYNEKYRKHILPFFGFKHYFIFFRARTYISTEQISRAVEIDSPSFLMWKHCRIGDDKITHVHLQHGVSYMISMASSSRSAARKSTKVPFYSQIYVVSSKKEGQYFIDCGDYDWEDLYVTGMPKFDRAVLNEGADKIVIMPTWRPWEENLALNNPKKTTYYKLIKRIQRLIPEELADKVFILPHPLFNIAFRYRGSKAAKVNYNEILKDTKLLITDYSSISYDAFYRGSNVVFVWTELKKCLKNYGENSALLLSEDDAFGDICYTDDELKEAIVKGYYGEQDQKYIDNYRTIVEFHDNRNCERVIESLERDKLIYR